ncbi:MAG: hypothetical protein IIA51_01380 [Chloroflexi bacterium]|nr:hypothetical protein [Chloroflexota bacterium]MDK1044535.1 hypothetical protein [Anaerolineales bacterium]MCH8340196.1 hypothetical protein [Chloroflexota bacterium]MCH8875462.1 hypothetical protein [Chloroflexota bacterium]MCI0772850.1 hypothetical protein [Chloroflexota bacterium]
MPFLPGYGIELFAPGAFFLTAWLAAALWLEYLLTPVEPALRWPLAIALAWTMAPFAAIALTSLAERLAPGPLQ